MKVVGIIAEYNPFHKGHHYQIEQIRKTTGADYIVVVMSGNYVQRGTPAWTDKYLRAQMALSCGADLVFELPLCYAASSAETFALGGIALLTDLGFVDAVCFGSECGELSALSMIAKYLINPNEEYHTSLKELLKKGYSYPKAREVLLSRQFPSLFTSYPNLLKKPNNILGMEYLKAIQLLNSPLEAITIKRKDSDYHSKEISAFSSATAIRHLSINTPDTFIQEAVTLLPPAVSDILQKEKNRFPITENDFSAMLFYSLSQTGNHDTILDMTRELSDRIQQKLAAFTSFSDFCMQLKTKQYTYNRISRTLLHILLGICTEEFPARRFSAQAFCQSALFQENFALIPYARLLGFHKNATHLLRKTGKIPVITKTANGKKVLDNFYSDNTMQEQLCFGKYLFEKECDSDSLYTFVQNQKLHCNRFSVFKQNPIILP